MNNKQIPRRPYLSSDVSILAVAVRGWRWRLAVAILVACLVGCGGPANKPVDSEVARQTLVRTMEHWQSGGLPADCQTWTPPVVVGHSRWSDGAKLTGFRLAEDRSLDANLFVNVELKLNIDGKQETIVEQYCVGTEPVLTVFRMMQPAF